MSQGEDTLKKLIKHKSGFRYAKNCHGKLLLVPKDMDPFVIWNLPDDYDWFHDQFDIVDDILLGIAEGKTLKTLCTKHKIPLTLVLHKADTDKEFGTLLFNARRYRAEGFHDALLDLAEQTDETNTRSTKTKADIYRMLMAVGDKERFSDTRQPINAGAGITVIVDTGIDRARIPAKGEVINAEFSRIEEKLIETNSPKPETVTVPSIVEKDEDAED